MGEVFIKIAGVYHQNDDGTNRTQIISEMKKYNKLYLVDAASSEYPEAITVYNSKKQQVGFVPKDDAVYIRSIIPDLKEIDASLYDSYRMRLRHLKLRDHSLGDFHPTSADWTKLRDTLGIDDDVKVTADDVRRYQRILAGRESAPVLTHPRKRITCETVIDYDTDSEPYRSAESYYYSGGHRIGCVIVIVLILIIVIVAIIFR